MVHLSEPVTRVLWQIAAWRAGDVASLRAIAAERLGLALPEAPIAAVKDDVVAFHIGPRRWWLGVGGQRAGSGRCRSGRGW